MVAATWGENEGSGAEETGGELVTGPLRPASRSGSMMAAAHSRTTSPTTATRPERRRGGRGRGSRAWMSGHRSGLGVRASESSVWRRSVIVVLLEQGAKPAARPHEVHAHGGGRRPDGLGDLARGVAERVVHHDGRALVSGQVPQG